jgi:outer membrane protein OmpA-like peptidoglycan-associated protein
MRINNVTGRGVALGAWLLMFSAIPACGGVIQFADKSALAVNGTPPPPPPAPEPKRVEVREDRIQINEKIQFAYNSAKILDVSFGLLKEIAQVLNDNPRIKKVEIGGHASSEGSDERNLELSDKRSKSVLKWLTNDGKVVADRLVAKGYGETKPLVSPDETEADREKNRRVEFLILEQDIVQKKVEIDPATGKETLVESTEKKETAP